MEGLRNSGVSAADVKKVAAIQRMDTAFEIQFITSIVEQDIGAMEDEKDQLKRRLERMRKKVEILVNVGCIKKISTLVV